MPTQTFLVSTFTFESGSIIISGNNIDAPWSYNISLESILDKQFHEIPKHICMSVFTYEVLVR